MIGPQPRPILPAVPAGDVIEPPQRASAATRLAVGISTAAGVGSVAPIAPGTFGSAVVLPVFVIYSPLSPMLLLGVGVVLFFSGVWASNAAEAHFGRPDDGRIVIDEVVGQLIALAPLAWLPVCGGGLRLGEASCSPWTPTNLWPVVTGFVLFRLFDIWKPGAVRWAEKSFPGGYGVMLDDVAAGLLAAAVLAGMLLWLAPQAGIA